MKDKSAVKKHHSPIPKGVQTKIMYPTGEYAHEKYPVIKYAKDFLIPSGTPIKAMEGGKVIFVKSDSNKYGLDKKFADDANIVAIEHKDGTAIEYVHMGKNKIYVKVGDTVKTGDTLGLSGLSGCMSAPHLHANKFKYDENGKPISVPYDVEGFEEIDERSQHNISGGSDEGSLEKIVGIIFIISIGISLSFLSGITGNIIGINRNNPYGLILIVISLVCGGIWVFLRKK